MTTNKSGAVGRTSAAGLFLLVVEEDEDEEAAAAVEADDDHDDDEGHSHVPAEHHVPQHLTLEDATHTNNYTHNKTVLARRNLLYRPFENLYCCSALLLSSSTTIYKTLRILEAFKS